MALTTTTTTAGSSSQNRSDNQKKITENEQIQNSNIATKPIDDLLKTALGNKKLNQLSARELDALLSNVKLLDAIGLDTQGKKIPNKGNNNNLSPISSPTAKTASTVSLPDLVGSFGTINLPTKVDFGATGSAQVIVTNQGQALASGPSTVNLYISTDGEIDSNDALLTSVNTNLNLSAGQSVTLNLTYNNNTSVIAPGAYFRPPAKVLFSYLMIA